MLTNEQLDNLEEISRKITGISLLEIIEELKQARKKETQPNSYNEKKILLVLPLQDGVPFNTLSLITAFDKRIKEKGGRLIFNYAGRHCTTKKNGEKEKPSQQEIQDLAGAIESLAECDAVYFCKGWRDARGCRAEFHVAKAYGLETWEEDLHQ